MPASKRPATRSSPMVASSRASSTTRC
jgi:hypothetical protein